MGSVTLLLRAPAVALARAFGGGRLAQYRVGCLICLLVAAGLAWVLVANMRPWGKQWILVAILLGLLLAGPLTAKALAWGHPEELVGALLCVVALVLASRGRIALAGVSLGLALATKQWAVLAVIPVVIAYPGERSRLLTITVGVAALFILPMVIGDPSRFLAQNLHVGIAPANGNIYGVTPTNIWFSYGKVGGMVIGPGGGTTYDIPASLGAVTHPVALVLGLGLPLTYWRLAKHRVADDLLLLLALLFLLRCLLDPLTISYHHVPFLVAIACYETLGRRRLPIVSIYSAAVLWVLARWIAPLGDAPTMNKVYLAWALPITVYLAYGVFAQRTSRLPAGRRQSPAAVGIASETS